MYVDKAIEMCAGRSSPGVKLTDCGAPKLIKTSCIWVTVLIISQQTVPGQPSQFLRIARSFFENL